MSAWASMGRQRYPKARQLVITADGGGSNGHRVRLWKPGMRHLHIEVDDALEMAEQTEI